jgi:hypothetical protein
VKCTDYFRAIRNRSDRAVIKDAWIQQAIRTPLREVLQRDGRIRRWTRVPTLGRRFLRVAVLPDGETVHNAFFDRPFKP